MKPRLVELLRCPACRAALRLESAQPGPAAPDITAGALVCTSCGASHPIVAGVPRFVESSGYASSFGFQWNEFRRTQLDSFSGVPISRRRFLVETRWDAAALAGNLVLDGGCGAGRFAEVALALGAEVVAIDYSSAVDAAWQNLGEHPRFHAVQANLYALPFAPASFDKVYSLGVLQHTPDVRGALLALVAMLRPGGRLAADFYLKRWTILLDPKYMLRPLTRRMPHQRLFRTIRRAVPLLLRISNTAGRIPLAGRYLRHAVPVANYAGVLPLDARQLHDWAVLDTFDRLSPRYDQPQTPSTVRDWLEEAGLQDVDVAHEYHLACRARKPEGPHA